jgi:hypothetical protein
MGAERKAAEWRRPAALGASLVLVALACLRPQPSSEGAPSPPPVTRPARAPAAPEPERVQPAEAREEAPASAAGGGVGGVGPGAPPPAAPANEPKVQRASPRKSSVSADSDWRGEEPPTPEALRRRLDRAYGASSPDCPSARDRKKVVCDLATQICSLTERDPNVASIAEYCDEARRRCSDAERRTSQRCPE